MREKIPATATILTYDSAATVERCLASVAAFAETLVLDGGSADGTVEIARAAGARVIPQSESPGPVRDFTAVRERSFREAAYDWIFVIDSDEHADAALVEAVRAAVATDDRHAAYRVERVPVVEGRVIRHAYFSPDRIIRLVHRTTARWDPGKRVHEHFRLADGTRAADLSGALYAPWKPIASLRKKDRYYLALQFSRPLERRPPLHVALRAVAKNLARAAWILAVAVALPLRYGRGGDVLPFAYHLRFSRYHAAVARERARQFLLGSRYAPPAA